jgi:hypothetical protein
MPYNSDLRPLSARARNPGDFGSIAEQISPSNSSDQLNPSGNYFSYFTVAVGGAVSFVPYENFIVHNFPDGATIPGFIRRIRATGTTATVIGWS